MPTSCCLRPRSASAASMSVSPRTRCSRDTVSSGWKVVTADVGVPDGALLMPEGDVVIEGMWEKTPAPEPEPEPEPEPQPEPEPEPEPEPQPDPDQGDGSDQGADQKNQRDRRMMPREATGTSYRRRVMRP